VIYLSIIACITARFASLILVNHHHHKPSSYFLVLKIASFSSKILLSLRNTLPLVSNTVPPAKSLSQAIFTGEEKIAVLAKTNFTFCSAFLATLHTIVNFGGATNIFPS